MSLKDRVYVCKKLSFSVAIVDSLYDPLWKYQPKILSCHSHAIIFFLIQVLLSNKSIDSRSVIIPELLFLISHYEK